MGVIRDLKTILSWFKTGMEPTQAQFEDTFTSFWHKEDDKIDLDAVEGLAEELNGKYSKSDGEAIGEQMAGIDDRLSDYDNFIDTLFKDVDEHEVWLNRYGARIEALVQENEEMRTEIAELTSKLESLAALVGTANAALEQRLKGL